MTTSSSRRVVVTGLGATTPVGGNVQDTWDAILAGRSGARPMPYDWVAQHQLPVTFAATLAVPTADVLSKVEVRRNDPSTQAALVAAREAWADAGAPEVEPERLAVCLGTGIGGVQTLLDQWDVLREKGPRRVFPLAVPMLMANGPAAAVSLELTARAGAHTPVSACAEVGTPPRKIEASSPMRRLNSRATRSGWSASRATAASPTTYPPSGLR